MRSITFSNQDFLPNEGVFPSRKNLLTRCKNAPPPTIEEVTHTVTQIDGSSVHVWYVPHTIETQDLYSHHPDDKREFGETMHKETRMRRLTTRSVLRRALTKVSHGAKAPDEWAFCRTTTTHPHVHPSLPQIKFSCSHTTRLSVIAASANGPVGIDVAYADLPAEPEFIACFFSARERVAVRALTRLERRHAVATLWTLKEASAKLNGQGIVGNTSGQCFAKALTQPSREILYTDKNLATKSWTCSALNRKLMVSLCHTSS